MTRRPLLVFALIAALSLVVAAPVSADTDKPISGTIELDLVLQPCSPDLFNTWVGTAVIDGTEYGWADFPTGPLVEEGNFLFFEEYWTIFSLDGGEALTLPEMACDGSRVILSGFNTGRGTLGGAAYANGAVSWADPIGPFADVDPGSRMFWRGKITNFKDAGDEFKATLHILPLK
jgi:hypothetical protein